MKDASQPVRPISAAETIPKDKLSRTELTPAEAVRSWLANCIVPVLVREYVERYRRVSGQGSQEESIAERREIVAESRSERIAKVKEAL